MSLFTILILVALALAISSLIWPNRAYPLLGVGVFLICIALLMGGRADKNARVDVWYAADSLAA